MKELVTSDPHLIVVQDPRSAVAEAFRTLRTNIQFKSLDKPIRTLLVTSSAAEEGKSTVVANLAVSLAQTGAAVIAVDCDLRNPSLHQMFGLPNERGLTSLMLAPDSSVRDCLQRSEAGGVDVLTSGPLPPNPVELLASQRMEAVVQQLRDMADYVVFDTPPVLAVTDALVLATKVDGSLLVLSAGRARRDAVKKAKRTLEERSTQFLGVVVNNVKLDREAQSGYYARS
ncbi:MAG TPA: CpsD/CapB family tyrosine-protein kinase [Chloroflexota bacterium]|nr:CpsD/CapB family tyrosine-protein kinase [Chloroflexota bacterium]